MSSKIFINLAVKDLTKTIEFFTQLGFAFNPQFTDENAACMVINDQAFAMLLTEAYFRGFTPKGKEVADAHRSTEVLLAFDVASRAAVDETAAKMLALGATEGRDPQDLGFMYSRSLNDLDGHIWEVFWMDPNAAPPQG